MKTLSSDELNILLSTLDGQRQESLQHRQTIFNSFSLSIAGLMVIFGGVVSADDISIVLGIVLVVTVIAICLLIIHFVGQQRSESDKSLKIIKNIQKDLNLYKPDQYLAEKSVLPDEFFDELPKCCCLGLSKGDWYVAVILIVIGLAIIVAAILRMCAVP